MLGAIAFRKDFFTEVEAKPDLYGPFWISTTAIFLMAMISNALDWIASRDDNWEGDLQKIGYCAAVMYGYVFGGAALLWVWLKVISLAQISLSSLWCIYGACCSGQLAV
jgi:protein YIPF1/2